MSKVIDITDKLNFDEKPKLVINGTELEVNTDAKTVLKMMGALRDKGEVEASLECMDLVFPQESKKKLDKLNLNFSDLTVVIQEAMALAIGADEEEEKE